MNQLRKLINIVTEAGEYTLAKERALKYKAGMIPYFLGPDGNIRMMFVISSDPSYGGPDPGIAKGGADPGETDPKVTALREVSEEAGLNPAAIKKTFVISDEVSRGLTSSYRLVIYGGLLAGMPQLGPHDHEIAEVVWLTPEEFASKGRKSQRQIVAALAKIVKTQTP